MNSSQSIRTIFLEEFVKRLIICSLPKAPKIAKTDTLFEKLDKTSAAPPALELKKKIEEKPLEKIEFKVLEEKPLEKKMLVTQKILAPITQKAPERAPVPIMEKLNPILADPTVQAINCPGPDKNITITRRGMVQTIAMAFTAEDITLFLKDISEKTKIPLLPGLFKVVFQNMIITAVISEFVGSKFIIEKRFAPALPPLPIKAQFK